MKQEKTLENVKNYLRQIKVLDTKINIRLNQLQDLRSTATNITSIIEGDRVQKSSSESKIENTVIRYLDLETEIKEKIEDLMELKNRIINQIEGLKDERYIQVLNLRYVEFLTWEEIADEILYTERQVYRIHGKALIAFNEILKKQEGADRCA